jgi:ketosteroid isomerase-like protein
MRWQSRALKQQVLCWTLACCIAGSSVTAEPTSSQAAPPTDARQQLLELEKEWAAAERNRDASVLRGILDDRFVATLGVKTYDKEAFIALFAGDVDPTASETLNYEAVLIDGDTAVLVGTDIAHGTREGAPYTAVYRYTTTYIRRQGHWVALAEHIVRVPQAK